MAFWQDSDLLLIDGELVTASGVPPPDRGLSGSVLAEDEERAVAVAKRIRTGAVSVNGGMWHAPDAPFGGYEQSGIRREHGTAGLEEFLQTKLLARPAAG